MGLFFSVFLSHGDEVIKSIRRNYYSFSLGGDDRQFKSFTQLGAPLTTSAFWSQITNVSGIVNTKWGNGKECFECILGKHPRWTVLCPKDALRFTFQSVPRWPLLQSLVYDLSLNFFYTLVLELEKNGSCSPNTGVWSMLIIVGDRWTNRGQVIIKRLPSWVRNIIGVRSWRGSFFGHGTPIIKSLSDYTLTYQLWLRHGGIYLPWWRQFIRLPAPIWLTRVTIIVWPILLLCGVRSGCPPHHHLIVGYRSLAFLHRFGL